MYGPFWIWTTLICLLFISGNISRYIRLGYEDFTYNFTVIPIACSIVYGVGIGLPLLMKIVLNLYGTDSST